MNAAFGHETKKSRVNGIEECNSLVVTIFEVGKPHNTMSNHDLGHIEASEGNHIANNEKGSKNSVEPANNGVIDTNTISMGDTNSIGERMLTGNHE